VRFRGWGKRLSKSLYAPIAKQRCFMNAWLAVATTTHHHNAQRL
jgi:hypothetical protein